MNINVLEEKIENLEVNNHYLIVKMIIEAVKDYPLFGLNDTDTYFEEVKKILKVKDITSLILNEYIKRNAEEGDENHIWFISSLSSLLEAFNLMDIYKISFDEILCEINEL